jgi:hypothetical protein
MNESDKRRDAALDLLEQDLSNLAGGTGGNAACEGLHATTHADAAEELGAVAAELVAVEAARIGTLERAYWRLYLLLAAHGMHATRKALWDSTSLRWNEKLVALRVIEFWPGEYPSIAQLSSSTGMSEAAVQSTLATLGAARMPITFSADGGGL